MRCLDPDLYCLDPVSSNVGRVSQTLSANLNAKILSASYELLYFRKTMPVSMAI